MMTLKRFLLLVSATTVALSGCTPEEPPVEEVETTTQIQQAVMVGMFQYMADAPNFTDCTTGKRYPVAMEEDYISLEKTYLNTQSEPGEMLLVTFEGQIEARPNAEGNELRDHVLVERFEHIWPGETCEKATVRTPLTNTYWKLVETRGKPVETHPDQREIHILFRPDNSQLTGFTGCNVLVGNYNTRGNQLAITLKVPPLTACPYLDDETRLAHTLKHASEFRIHGESMILLARGRVLSRFKAIYFK
jgi:copper homeostasis protein (lipoprotein)